MPIGFAKLSALRFAKTAFTDSPESEGDSHAQRNALMAAAAAAPFAGMLGQAPMKHRGQGELIANYEDFMSRVQPGDIILNGERDMTPARKLIVGGVTGNPEGYHVSVVRDNAGNLIDAAPRSGLGGVGYRKEQYVPKPTDRLQILRPKFTPEERAVFMDHVQQADDVGKAYHAKLREALHQAGTPNAEALSHRARGGTYDTWGGIRAGAKEILMPKWVSDKAINLDKLRTEAARHDFLRDQNGVTTAAGRAGAERVGRIESSGKATGPLAYTGVTSSCVGGICSTIPAQAMPEGKQVVPGKLPRDILASDYLRSDLFEPVARYQHGTPRLSERILHYGPTALRAGAGLTAAAGVYGLSRLLERKKKPQLTEDSAAAAATTASPT